MALVWGFDFKPAVNVTTGKPEVVDTWAYEAVRMPFGKIRLAQLMRRFQGALLTPKRFEFSIKARSLAHERVIREQFTSAVPSFAPYEKFLGAEEREWLSRTRGEHGLTH
jgi:hypothetical protein